MKILDRILKAAADLHAKRNPTPAAAPQFMVFTPPGRGPSRAPCDTCATVFDDLDALGRSMPSTTDPHHFLQAVGNWWLGATMTTNQGDIKKTVETFFVILRENGIPAVLAPMPMAEGSDRAH